MPKKFLRTDETYEVLRNHVGAIAKEYSCWDSYISAIKNGDSNDPFAQFRHLFVSAEAVGAPVEIWLRDLQSIIDRRKRDSDVPLSQLLSSLSAKIEADSQSTSEILNGMVDRDLDRAECHRILAALEVSRDIDKGIGRLVSQRLAEMDRSLKLA